MSRKIFVSYKYGDQRVQSIFAPDAVFPTTVRQYVDVLQARLEAADQIYKGEDDGEDLSVFKDETIASRLRDKIFDSTITVILLSKGMKDANLAEAEQWIPWEISYSLKEITRNGRVSRTNGLLAVALPDENGSYEYIMTRNQCVTSWNTDVMFRIVRHNLFNKLQANTYSCSACGGTHHAGHDHSYIYPTTWDEFIGNINGYFDHVSGLQENLHQYMIRKEV